MTRRPESKAFIAAEDGDLYYCGGAFGGVLQEVHLLAKTCRHNFEADAKNGIGAAWHEESHLNRYMWINKPNKLLSPEYLWQDFAWREPEIKIIRFSGIVKNYAEIRPNK
ncbi:globoside alpha-1,3-N-acetylgalactosaminyltransferase 1-like [Symphorus nematophorus]